MHLHAQPAATSVVGLHDAYVLYSVTSLPSTTALKQQKLTQHRLRQGRVAFEALASTMAGEADDFDFLAVKSLLLIALIGSHRNGDLPRLKQRPA
jgi:hypothetical protein